VAAPWTQNIRITWRPELRFYERRIDLLRELEDLGHLRAFRVTDTGVEARLFDSMHILAVRSNGVMLRFLGPEESHTADAWDTLTRAIAAMEPQSIIEMSAAYQHLAPLTMTFEEALAQSYKTFLTQPGGELVLGDWAMLVDVDKVGDVPANGQIEFGIVRAREVPDRLSHRAGRLGEETAASEQSWEGRTFAETSLFAESALRIGSEASAGVLAREGSIVHSARKFSTDAQLAVNDFVDRVQQALLPNQEEAERRAR
jgi:hypothetical protein